MKNSPILAALLLALPVAATAQTKTSSTAATPVKAAPATQQVTEVTEELDPATGKVIRRTTRTTTAPVGTAPASTPTSSKTTASAADASSVHASDTQVTDFFREKTTVASLNSAGLLDAYSRFMDKVHEDRRGWKPADWTTAASVLSSLNARYEELRPTMSLDDKVTVRSQQAEFQALRTARQLSDQVSDKL